MKIYLFLIIGNFLTVSADDRDWRKVDHYLSGPLTRPKRQNLAASRVGPDCQAGQVTLTFPDCPSSNVGVPYFNNEKFNLVTSAQSNIDCKIPTFFYSWKVTDANNGAIVLERWTPDRTLSIGPYMSYYRKQKVMVYAALDKMGTNFTEEISCFIQLKIIPLVAKIGEGVKKYVLHDQSFDVSGTHSKNLNNKDRYSGMNYKWKCKITEGLENDFCSRGLNDGPTITVPSKYAIVNITYEFTLTVLMKPIPNVTVDLSSYTHNTKQLVFVRNQVIDIEIQCRKNCVPESDVTLIQLPVILEAVCTELCDQVTEDSYEWTIPIIGIDYDKDTKHGKNKNIFYLNPNTLSNGEEYDIHVALSGGLPGVAEYYLATNKPPKLSGCEARPSIGNAVETRFKIFCVIESEFAIVGAKIYRRTDSGDVLVTHNKHLGRANFVLAQPSEVPEKVEVVAVVTDENHMTASAVVEIKVKSNKLTSMTEAEARNYFENKYFSGERKKFLDSHIDELATAAYELGSLNNITDKDGKPMEEKLLRELSKINITHPADANQVVEISRKIAAKFKNKPDPAIARLATQVCEKAAEAYLKSLQSAKHSGSHRESATNISSSLTICSEAGTTENKDAVTTKDILNISTPFPLNVDDQEITEDYPDYMEDTNATKAMSEFDQAGLNVINTCFSTAKILAFTMVAYEDTLRQTGENYEITATKNFGRDMNNFNLTVENVTLFPSTDFSEKPKEVYHIYMCASSKNPFWFLQSKPINTSVALLQFTDANGTVLNTFKNPFKLSFLTDPNKMKGITNAVHDAILPQKAADEIMDNKHFYEIISMYCIDVPKMQGFVVEFKNLTPEDSFDVLMTDFSKPTLSEFKKNAIKVTEKNLKFYQSHDHDYDGWHFLSVLPGKSGANKGSYSFSIYTFSCITWNTQDKDWHYACKTVESSTTEQINCECYHTSVYAGGVFDNEIRLETNQEFSFNLPFQSFDIIFSVLAVTFAIYCILFTLISLGSEQSFLDNVLFLSDVPYADKFAYLIIVKTGDMKNAGTTSNVTIKLRGEVGESKEHVLNYPDPELKLLQKNGENWFVLGSTNYLGYLKEVSIWFDAIGHSPSWYLSKIEIYDMQTTENWIFNVEQWFQLGKDDERYCVTFRTDENDLRLKETAKKTTLIKRMHKWFGANEFGPHLWDIMHHDAQLSKIKRLTIMYSVLLTTFTCQLFLYEVPKFDDSDSISYVNDYGIYTFMIWITVAGFFCAMAVHFPLVYFFRKYNKIYVDLEDNFKSGRREIIVTNVCWGVLILTIMTCMTILIVFGMWIPNVTALLWLTTIIASIVIYVLLFENVFRKIYSLMFKVKKKIDVVDQLPKVIEHVLRQRSFIYKKFGRRSLRRYFTHLYQPLEEPKKKERRNWIIAKQRIFEMMEDLIMIGVYVALLYLVILADRPTKAALYGHREMESMILGEHVETVDDGVYFESIREIPDILKYMNYTLIPTIHGLHWYGRYVYKYPGMMKDFTNKYLGVVRYRQLRVRSNTCQTPKALKVLNLTCRPEFTSYVSDKGTYEEKWLTPGVTNIFSRMASSWKYTYSNEAGTLPTKGDISSYPGGGYIAKGGRTLKNSLVNFEYIEKNLWLDQLTRAVFVEFLTYSPNINIFMSVSVRFEMSATGYMTNQINIHSAKLLFVKNELTLMRSVVFVAFAISLIFLTGKILYRIGTTIRIFYKNVWLWLDASIIVLNVGVVTFYTYRPTFVKKFVDELSKHNNNEFVNYFRLFDSELVLTILAAILVFVATLRLWKLLRFLLIFKVVGKTLKDSAMPIMALLCFHLVTIMGFTVVGTHTLGDESPNFQDYSETIILLFLLFCGIDETLEIEYFKRHVERTYYSVYMLSSLLFNVLYITIIVIYYKRATVYYSNEESDHVIRYLKEQYVFYTAYAKVKLSGLRIRGGGKEREEFSKFNAVIPKSDQHRYAKMLTVTTQKMKTMALTAQCFIRNKLRPMNHLNEEDYALMRDIAMTLVRGDKRDQEKFFISNNFKSVTLVDDLRLENMEEVVEDMLSGERRQKKKEEREKFVAEIMDKRTERFSKINENLTLISGILHRIHIKTSH